MTGSAPLRVVVIAPLRFAIRRPHAGGLESAVWNEVSQLCSRGHDVTLIAVTGSDWVEPHSPFAIPAFSWPTSEEPTDDTYPEEYEAISVPALGRALDLVAATPLAYDVISNHCLHGLPLQRAGQLGIPMVSTLHTPVDFDLVAAHAAATVRVSSFLSVSEFTQRQWAAAGIDSGVLPNAVDANAWPLGPGGPALVWFGRIVPEKAPHVAIDVAEELGRSLILAGRIGDAEYARDYVLPRLNNQISYVGELLPQQLAELVGLSACSIATPSWDEPFGLVAPEALMCGTPVASFHVGGVAEIAEASLGMTTAPRGDVAALAADARALIERSESEPNYRLAIRARAIERFSLTARMDALEQHFREAIDGASDRSGQAA